ncbi:MAG: UvrB/UvrC motif-containing protein, partial [Parcubacteria group bacterium]
NVKEKDDKSFSYFVITKEEFPRVLIIRETDLDASTKDVKNLKFKIKNSHMYGPYTSKKQMEIALRIMRKIFPFHSRAQHGEQGCLDFQLGRCPGPYAGAISKADYAKNIRGIRMILAGQKKSLVKKLEKEMQAHAERQEFEKASEMKNKVFALQHIRDVALISNGDENFKFQISNFKTNLNDEILNSKFRIEAYDISNISGQYAVGSMVVFEGSEPTKAEYRKFKIKTVAGANDVAMMREVLLRRLKNNWPQPDLIILDGGKGHLHMAEKLLQVLGLAIPLVAVAKGPTRKKLELARANWKQVSGTVVGQHIEIFLQDKNLVKYITDEAHRFAISYHRKVRQEGYLQ